MGRSSVALSWISVCWLKALPSGWFSKRPRDLWLQTHFESEHWELLADGLITLCRDDVERLCSDAAEAGLSLDPLPSPTSSNRV